MVPHKCILLFYALAAPILFAISCAFICFLENSRVHMGLKSFRNAISHMQCVSTLIHQDCNCVQKIHRSDVDIDDRQVLRY